MAAAFAAESARLVLHYRSSRANAEALQRRLDHADSIVVRADLTKENEVARMFASSEYTALAHHTRVDSVKEQLERLVWQSAHDDLRRVE